MNFPGRKCSMLLILVMLSALFAACSEDNTILPAVEATLEVFFDPNPAPVVDYGEYTTLVCVGNPTGVGVFIHGALEQPFSPSGEPYNEETHDELWYKRYFSANPSEGAYLPAGEIRCVIYTLTDARQHAYADWTFFGEDDLGNAVDGTERLYFGAVH